MENKIFTVAIIGTGARGADTYGTLMMQTPEKFKIVSLCDKNPQRLERYGKEFGVDKSLCFLDEDEFFTEKRADLLVIATQDKDHVGHCLKAFKTGYDILMEKPITDSREECLQVLEAQKKYGRKALICHVLRYAPAFLKVAELLDNGEIGRLVTINATENVGYWHQAHSYVRGNWRTKTSSAPMILAKCCHDLDLLQYYAKSACESISSVGELTYFNQANAPEDSAKRCVECSYQDSCPYSAKRIYINRWEESNSPTDLWPYNVIAPAPLTKEKLLNAIQTGPYGRCVFHCDNDVVDHQITQMAFENGVKATLTMTAFTAGSGRRIDFFGTHGEICLEEQGDTIYVGVYGKPVEIIQMDNLTDKGYGHGGGDYFLIESLYDMLEGKASQKTSLECSAESHLIGIAAEESRLHGGKLVKVH